MYYILNNIIHVSQIIIPVYSLKFSLNYKSIWKLNKWMNINMATYMSVNNAVNFFYNIKIHLQRTLYIQVSEHKQIIMTKRSMHFKSFLHFK